MQKANKEIQELIKSVSDDLKADIFLYSADISEQNADKLINLVRTQSPKKENAALILSTFGGDPDSAFRMARILKQSYSNFILFVFGYCKSAGTLVAIASDEIVMSDMAELGPLDVQLLKENDFRRSSGLDLQQALTVLSDQVFTVFEKCFLGTLSKSGGVVSTKMAAEFASATAVGLLSPIASQIDPIRLGEVWRSMNVAYEYGIRLNPAIRESIIKLVEGYPSHSFVIDRKEAKDLFKNVRPPLGAELKLEEIFFQIARSPSSEEMIFPLDIFVDSDDLSSECEDDEEGEDIQEGDNLLQVSVKNLTSISSNEAQNSYMELSKENDTKN